MSDQGAPYRDPELQADALRAFVAKHAKPYTPTADGYERQPFAEDTKEGKNDPTYGAHSYHTKVPPRSIIPYILHYTQPGDLILDLFCGSGMTGVAAQMCVNPPPDILQQFPDLKGRTGPRACILNDLSPAACHIAYNYNTAVDLEDLKCELGRIKTAVTPTLDWLYGTEHYEPSIGAYDASSVEVAARLKAPPVNASTRLLPSEQERTWNLLTKAEVESRLGYPVTELPRDDKWSNLDLAQVEQWICIPATTQYTIWSDIYRCQGFVTVEEPTGKISTRGKNAGKPMVRKRRVARGCGREIVLWQVAVNKADGEVNEFFKCPNPECQHSWRKINLKRCGIVPVVSKYAFNGLQQTKRGITSISTRFERPCSSVELAHIKDISNAPYPSWVPTQPMDKMGPQYRRNALRARNIEDARDFYTARNLRALSLLWHEADQCQNPRVGDHVRFCITSILHPMTRMYAYRPDRNGGILKGSLYIPSLTQEMNVATAFWGKVPEIVAVAERRSQFNVDVIVNCGSATKLPIPDNSVDYVFTDPPFGSNIYYSEASHIWESWLAAFTDRSKEAVVHRKLDGGTKRLPDYSILMQAAFQEVFRVLKPGRWVTVEFNNSDGAVFEAVKHAIRDAGFEIANMLLLDKEQKTFKQVKGAEGVEDVVDKDVLFNLFKPTVAGITTRSENSDVERHLAEAVRQHLSSLPERMRAEPAKYNDEHRTTSTINSMLMNVLIPRGVSVELLNLPFIERICSRYFRKVGQHWYLRGESVGGATGEALIEDEMDVKDELTAIAWLRQKIQLRPMLIGELKPFWMRATGLLPASVSEELVLDMLLSENFWRDPDTNRWREPTEEEREKMNDDRSIRVLHDAERFIAGSLHRTTSDLERCEWIDVLFKACRQVEDGDMQSVPALRGFNANEGYRLITRLFQSVLREKVPADLYARAQKQTAAASNRISQGVRDDDETRKTQALKSQGPTLFDEVK